MLSSDNRVTILRRSVKHLIHIKIANNEDQVERKQTAEESEEQQETTRSKRPAAVMEDDFNKREFILYIFL